MSASRSRIADACGSGGRVEYVATEIAVIKDATVAVLKDQTFEGQSSDVLVKGIGKEPRQRNRQASLRLISDCCWETVRAR
jgi:hypothetical protein